MIRWWIATWCTIAALLMGAFLLVATPVAWLRTPAENVRPGNHERARSQSAAVARGFVYPLELSSNRRYLVDQRNVPFLIVGDSPQALIGKLSARDAGAYITNRKAAGFNSLWVNLLCATYTGCHADGTTFDGIKPFTAPGDLSKPNPDYFARADAIIRLAAKAGIVVFLDPIETGGWLGVLRNNGIAKDYAYGRFLGTRYKSFGNIVWYNGNDFQTWAQASDDAVVLAVANGIRSVDRTHLQTLELNYPQSASREDARWASVVKLDAAYTYYPTYAKVLAEYNRKNFGPVFMTEAAYEFEQNSSLISKGDPQILRRQEYWSILAGAAGQFYGNHYTWQFADTWKAHLDTLGSAQVGLLANLFENRQWFRLVPDQRHKLVTSGYGRFTSSGNVGSSNYVTSASTRDGKLVMSYLPEGGTIVVDTARLAGRAQARWYDPTNGTFTVASGVSPSNNGRKIVLTAPSKNAAGDRDWVLLLTAH